MPNRRPQPLRRSLFPLLMPLLAVPQAEAPRASPAPTTISDVPLWVVSDGGRSVYLLGSVHMLRPDAYPLDDALDEAFQASEVVAFELDLGELEASVGLMLSRGTYTDGRTLRDEVPADTYGELADRLQAMGVPPQMFEVMKPWLATMMLSSLAIQQAGFTAESGVDVHYYDRAREEGKEILALETVEDQIEVFDGLSPEAQIAFLEGTLDRLDDAVERMDELSTLWARGDADGLANRLTESLESHPELTERLLYARNRSWVPQIESLLAEPRPAIVIVGMGHMVGEGSVVELLRERGHTVERWDGS